MDTSLVDWFGTHLLHLDEAVHADAVPNRMKNTVNGIEIKTDVHGCLGSSISYLVIPPDKGMSTIRILRDIQVEWAAGGTLGPIVHLRHAGKPYLLWLPEVSLSAQLDQHSRISPKGKIHHQWRFHKDLTLRLYIYRQEQEQKIFIPLFVTAGDIDPSVVEFSTLKECECRLYLKSEWFVASDPSDIWKYLINGSIYDPRSCPPVEKRFKCQQCAYAWWTYFDYLHKETRKKIWLVLRNEVAFCALKDMDDAGAWRNGFWSDEMEIHSRFQLDGLHLLISQYERTRSQEWLDAAKRGMRFVQEQLTDPLEDGSIWYLHDDVHASKRHKIKSTAFGKSPGNSLCLNTHIQALTVLHRLCLHGDKEKDTYERMFRDGIQALQRVMSHQPADSLYRFLVPRMLAVTRDAGRSTIGLIKNRLEKRILKKIYWKVRARFPRLVQPNGFIERDLTVEAASDRYHVTNLKDLLTLYLQRPLPWLRSYIVEGFEYLLDYLRKACIETAIRRSPYFIEVAEIMYMYDQAIQSVSPKDFCYIVEGIQKETHGSSLDSIAKEALFWFTLKDIRKAFE